MGPCCSSSSSTASKIRAPTLGHSCHVHRLCLAGSCQGCSAMVGPTASDPLLLGACTRAPSSASSGPPLTPCASWRAGDGESQGGQGQGDALGQRLRARARDPARCADLGRRRTVQALPGPRQAAHRAADEQRRGMHEHLAMCSPRASFSGPACSAAHAWYKAPSAVPPFTCSPPAAPHSRQATARRSRARRQRSGWTCGQPSRRTSFASSRCLHARQNCRGAAANVQ